MNATTQHLESIAHLCASIQAPYARIAKAVESLGLSPTITINGIGHYDAKACELIADYLGGKAPKPTAERLVANDLAADQLETRGGVERG